MLTTKRRRKLKRYLNKIKKKVTALLVCMFYLEITTLKEICELLDVDVDTIKSQPKVVKKAEVLRIAIEYGIFDMSKMSLDFGETEIEFIEKELLTSVLNNN
jgi:hypothetical protein